MGLGMGISWIGTTAFVKGETLKRCLAKEVAPSIDALPFLTVAKKVRLDSNKILNLYCTLHITVRLCKKNNLYLAKNLA